MNAPRRMAALQGLGDSRAGGDHAADREQGDPLPGAADLALTHGQGVEPRLDLDARPRPPGVAHQGRARVQVRGLEE